jgi:hypothetical protein
VARRSSRLATMAPWANNYRRYLGHLTGKISALGDGASSRGLSHE